MYQAECRNIEKNRWSSLPPRTSIISNLITVINLNLQSSVKTKQTYLNCAVLSLDIKLTHSSPPTLPRSKSSFRQELELTWTLPLNQWYHHDSSPEVSGDFTLWMVKFQWLMGYVSFSILLYTFEKTEAWCCELCPQFQKAGNVMSHTTTWFVYCHHLSFTQLQKIDPSLPSPRTP